MFTTKIVESMQTAQLAYEAVEAESKKSVFVRNTTLLQACKNVYADIARNLAAWGVIWQPNDPSVLEGLKAKADRYALEKQNVKERKKRLQDERNALALKLLAEGNVISAGMSKSQPTYQTGW